MLYLLCSSSLPTIKAGHLSEIWSSCSGSCLCPAPISVLESLIVKFVGLRVPSMQIEIGSASSCGLDPRKGYPLNNVPMRNRFSKLDGSRDSAKSTSSLQLRISPMTRGEARWARIRSTSRIDDLPLLFLPVIKFTRPSSLMLSSRKPRYRSTVNFLTLRSIRPPPAHCSGTVDIGAGVASANCSQPTTAARDLSHNNNRDTVFLAMFQRSDNSGAGVVGFHFDPCGCCTS